MITYQTLNGKYEIDGTKASVYQNMKLRDLKAEGIFITNLSSEQLAERAVQTKGKPLDDFFEGMAVPTGNPEEVGQRLVILRGRSLNQEAGRRVHYSSRIQRIHDDKAGSIRLAN